MRILRQQLRVCNRAGAGPKEAASVIYVTGASSLMPRGLRVAVLQSWRVGGGGRMRGWGGMKDARILNLNRRDFERCK